ncbi:MAG TPA: aldose 1-epimerase [Acidobacteriaceae bacterium]|nr:aldose 1-epimerase [Acidobacteriaceae bacterium]
MEENAPGVQIGGQAVIHLIRKPTLSGNEPEFLSATILPGRGMNLFQLTANIPGRGETPLLASPSLKDAALTLDEGPADAHGVNSFAFGGAFLAPYANRIRGRLTPDRMNVATEWNGRRLILPAVWKGKKPGAELHAIHGLILARKTDRVHVEQLTDGQSVTGTMDAGDFDGYWPSRTRLIITVALTGRSLEATIVASNVGQEPEPMGIGWHPYFAFPSGDRSQVRLRIPAADLTEVNNYDDVFPTGNIVTVKGTQYDFEAAGGKALGDIFLDDNFSRLMREDGQVVVDVIDPAAAYGLHIKGLSSDIRTIQVYAPPDKQYAAIEEQFNFADPFSAVWKGRDTGMVTLAPGQSVTWKARLELFIPKV